MASLAHAIQTFQKGDLSRNEFFAQIDRALATERGNWQRLKEILSEENTRGLLPPDVYAELQRRVEAPPPEPPAGAENGETRLRTTSAMLPERGPIPVRGYDPSNDDPDRMKGVGDTLNSRFVLEECIGFGGMGTVYKALDLRKLEASDRKPYIAIKVLNVQFRGHPKSLITLQREAKKAQALAHPNIVTVYDFDRDGSVVYLTMEYLVGRPLSQVLRAPGFQGMPFAEVLRIVSGIGRALGYAHQQGFVHCDLKPGNIFLTNKGEVKVIDFGIARAFHKPEDDAEATVFDPGSLGGLTPAYASPEMVEHREPDPRDDIYGLACITWEMLTGRHPFNRLSGAEARAAGMKLERPRQIGFRQWRALKAALSFDRASRTPSIEAFMQGLRGEMLPRETMALAAAGLAALLLMAAGIGYYLEFRQETRTEKEVASPAPQSRPAPEIALAPSPKPTPTPTPTQTQTPTPTPTPAPAPKPQPLALSAVEPVLAGLSCTALMPTVRGDALTVQGYLADSVGQARLREMLTPVPGLKKLDMQTEQVSEDKCGVLGVLSPYWLASRKAGRPATLQAKAANAQLVEGEPLVVNITTPPYEGFVTVDYYALDGSVLHMVPGPRARGNRTPASYSATIGGMGNWIIAKPFGTEMIALIVTPAPLFEAARPETEPKAAYLKALDERLSQLGARHGRDKVAVDLLQVTTRARR
ncbi:MAG: serine/threonine-protein kinase [Noviherbaspirillum sp.]